MPLASSRLINQISQSSRDRVADYSAYIHGYILSHKRRDDATSKKHDAATAPQKRKNIFFHGGLLGLVSFWKRGEEN